MRKKIEEKRRAKEKQQRIGEERTKVEEEEDCGVEDLQRQIFEAEREENLS